MRRRVLIVAAWLLLGPLTALPLAGSAATAQAPPLPPHQFFGDAASVDGAAAPDGSVVAALNENSVEVGSTVITDGLWDMLVSADDAAEVRFRIGGSALSGAHAVVGGDLTEIALDLSSVQAPDPETENDEPPSSEESDDAAANEPPAVLPNGGSGGLAQTGDQHDGGRRAAMIAAGALAVAIVSALGFRTLSGHAEIRRPG